MSSRIYNPRTRRYEDPTTGQPVAPPAQGNTVAKEAQPAQGLTLPGGATSTTGATLAAAPGVTFNQPAATGQTTTAPTRPRISQQFAALAANGGFGPSHVATPDSTLTMFGPQGAVQVPAGSSISAMPGNRALLSTGDQARVVGGSPLISGGPANAMAERSRTVGADGTTHIVTANGGTVDIPASPQGTATGIAGADGQPIVRNGQGQLAPGTVAPPVTSPTVAASNKTAEAIQNQDFNRESATGPIAQAVQAKLAGEPSVPDMPPPTPTGPITGGSSVGKVVNDAATGFGQTLMDRADATGNAVRGTLGQVGDAFRAAFTGETTPSATAPAQAAPAAPAGQTPAVAASNKTAEAIQNQDFNRESATGPIAQAAQAKLAGNLSSSTPASASPSSTLPTSTTAQTLANAPGYGVDPASQSAQPAPLGKPALYKPGQISASFGAGAPGGGTAVNTPPTTTATTPAGSTTFDTTNPLASPISLDLGGTVPQRPRIADSFSPGNDQGAAAGGTPTASTPAGSGVSPQAASTDAARNLANAPTAAQALAAAPGFGASPGTDAAVPASPGKPALAPAPGGSPDATQGLPPGDQDQDELRRRQAAQGAQRPNIAAMFA